jgi:transposase
MDYDYVTGFFDAEGSVWFKEAKFKDGYVRKIIRLQFVNTNEFALREIQKFLNAGYIYQYQRVINHFGKKPIYVLYVYKKEDIIRIAKEFLKFSLIKRKKLIELLNYLKINYEETKPEITYSYIAGLIDGDGSITKRDNLWIISICNKDKDTLEKIKEFVIQNALNYIGIRKKAEIYEDNNVYNLHINNQKVVHFLLKNIENHVLIKKDVVEQALKSINIERKNYRFVNYTKDELKKILEDFYLNQKLSIRQIAKKLNVRYGTIQRWLIKFNIPRREGNPEKIVIPKEELFKLYVEQKKSANEIAKIYNVAHTTILDKLEKYGIEKRKDKKLKDIPNLKEELKRLYIKEGKTMEEIASIFNVSKEAIFKWLKKFKIERKIPTISIEKSDKKLSEIPKEELKQILTDLYNKGLSLAQIAELYSTTKQAVREWFLKFNIPRRKTSKVLVNIKFRN